MIRSWKSRVKFFEGFLRIWENAFEKKDEQDLATWLDTGSLGNWQENTTFENRLGAFKTAMVNG